MAATSRTALAVEHDPDGSTILPAVQILRADTERVSAHAGVESPDALSGAVDPDVYVLSWAGAAGAARWVVGRQQVLGGARPQTLDGVRLAWDASDTVELVTWGGWARHQDLDDLSLAGVGVVRLGANAKTVRWSLSGGVQAAAGPETPAIFRQDIQASARAGRATARVGTALAESADGALTVERALLLVEMPVTTPARARVVLAHTQAADPGSLLGQGVLGTFAPDGVDEAGVGCRISGARWAVFDTQYTTSLNRSGSSNSVDSTEGAGSAVGGDAERLWGHRATASWVPGRTGRRFTVAPSYRFAASGGGEYHALQTRLRAELADLVVAAFDLGVVPYQKLDEPWDLALSGAARLIHAFGMGAAEGSLIVSRDAVFDLEIRGGGVLTLEWR